MLKVHCTVQPLQHVQNAATRFIFNLSRKELGTRRLIKLHASAAVVEKEQGVKEVFRFEARLADSGLELLWTPPRSDKRTLMSRNQRINDVHFSAFTQSGDVKSTQNHDGTQKSEIKNFSNLTCMIIRQKSSVLSSPIYTSDAKDIRL